MMNDFFIFIFSYFFLVVRLNIVWSGPFPWPSMMGAGYRAAAEAAARGM
jgi:hypothetical protein